MGKPAKEARSRSWTGVSMRERVAGDVFAVLDKRPVTFTAGDVVAFLVLTYGAEALKALRTTKGKKQAFAMGLGDRRWREDGAA